MHPRDYQHSITISVFFLLLILLLLLLLLFLSISVREIRTFGLPAGNPGTIVTLGIRMRLNFQSTVVLPLQYRIALQLTNVIDGVKIWEKKDKRENTNLTYFSTSIDIQANS